MSTLSEALTRLGERLKAAEAEYADGTFDTFLVFDTPERHDAWSAEHRAAWAEFHEARQALDAAEHDRFHEDGMSEHALGDMHWMGLDE